MNEADIIKLAFIDELARILEQRGEKPLGLAKLASHPALDELIKEARLFQALKSLGKKVSPTQRQLTKYKDVGVGDVAEKALQAQKPSKKLESWGKTMRQTPVQRSRAAGQKIAPSEAREITDATKRMGGTSVSKRMMGSAAEGAGHHVGHSGAIGAVGGHVGIPIGGAFEGLTRQAGRELKSVGTGMRARAAKSGGSTAGRAVSSTGQGLQRAAPALGLAGEVAGMAALPLPTAAGSVGQYLSPGLAQAGSYASHLGEKVFGTAGIRGVGQAASRAAPYAKPLGKAVKRVGPAMVGMA